MTIKQLIKGIMPPFVWDVLRFMRKERSLYYFGDFTNFAEAEKRAAVLEGGYSAPNIIEQVDEATQKVRKGEAVYEQDGVCYYKENNNYEFLAALLYVKMQLGEISILDFGGALGSSYFRYRNLLEEINAKWCVVEQKHFIDRRRENVPEISFYYNMDEALASSEKPNVLLLSSVIQYLDEPYRWLRDMLSKGFEYIIFDETPFNTDESAKSKVMLQHVPAHIYKAIYPMNLLGQAEFREQINSLGYEIVWEWVYRGGQIPIKQGMNFKATVDKGFLIKKKTKE